MCYTMWHVVTLWVLVTFAVHALQGSCELNLVKFHWNDAHVRLITFSMDKNRYGMVVRTTRCREGHRFGVLNQVTYSAMLTWSATLSIAWDEYESATFPAQQLIFSNWIPNGCCKLKTGNVLAFFHTSAVYPSSVFFFCVGLPMFYTTKPYKTHIKLLQSTASSPSSARGFLPLHSPWRAHF